MTASPPCSPPTPDRRDHRHRIILGVGNAGAHRVRRWASFGATVVTSSVLAIMGTAGTAAASPDNGVCVLEQEPIQWKQSAFIPGNGHTNLVSEAGYVNGDLLRFRASGNTQIATWGDHKDPNGDAAVAPDNGRWPAPGVRKSGAFQDRLVCGRVGLMSEDR